MFYAAKLSCSAKKFYVLSSRVASALCIDVRINRTSLQCFEALLWLETGIQTVVPSSYLLSKILSKAACVARRIIR
jgi:hypothetical protein